MIRIKLVVGVYGNHCILHIPRETQENAGELDLLHAEVTGDVWDFSHMQPGVYFVDYSIPMHVCSHPECAHDNDEGELENYRLIYVGDD
jgi:hypothetical protein